MTRINSKVEPQYFVEILDEEFNHYVEVAKTLMKSLKNPKDVSIVAKYIRKCSQLTAPSIEVKSNRNNFFKYFLKMLQAAVATQPPVYDTWFKTQNTDNEEKVTSHWTPDRKTYVAAKTIPGFGTLIYMAVSYDTERGWQPYGFSSCDF